MPKVVAAMKFSFCAVIIVISLTSGCNSLQDRAFCDPITFALERDGERYDEQLQADYEDYPERLYNLTATQKHKIWVRLISAYVFSSSYGIQNRRLLRSMEQMAEKDGSTVTLKFDSTLTTFEKDTAAHRYFPNQKDSKGFPATSPVYFFFREMSFDRNSANKIRDDVFSYKKTAANRFPIPGTYPDEIEAWILESASTHLYQKSRGLPSYALDVDMAHPATIRSTSHQEKLNVLHFLMWKKYISKNESMYDDYRSASILTKEVSKWGLIAPSHLNTYIQLHGVEAQPEELRQYERFVNTCKK
jgi:hypothetical protein